MLVQVPISLNDFLGPWTAMLEQSYREVIEFSSAVGISNKGCHQDHSVFRLRKLRGAPVNLPFLEPRVVRQISKTAKKIKDLAD